MNNHIILTVLILIGHIASAAQETSQSFTFDGRAFANSTATSPLLDPSIQLKIQILNPTQACILYEETQTVNTMSTNGYFTISVGSAISNAKRSSNDSNNAMSAVYSNTLASVAGKLVSSGAACTYTPASGDKRYVRILMTPSSDGVTRTLSPLMSLDAVPSAVVAERAESLQGLAPNQLLQVNTTTSSLSQANLESMFSATNFSRLNTLVSVPPANYVQTGSNGSAALPNVSGNPSSGLTKGQIWYDSSTDLLKYYDGSVKTLGTSGGSVNSVATGTGLTGGPITTSGTIAVDVGVTAGKIVQVAIGDKLPVIDGSNLTNVAATSLTGNASTQNIQVWDSTSTRKVTITAPAIGSFPANYNLILPGALPGSTGQALTSDTSGNLSWMTPQSTSLASGKIWVGSAGNVATAQSPSGDVTMDNAGAFTVSQIKGTPVSATPLSAGQVLKYDGTTNYTPGFIGIGDIRSSVAGNAQFFPTNCTAGQTLVWQSASDVMACTNISVSASSLGSQSANQVLAGPTSGSATPTFRNLVAADLPATVVYNGGNTVASAMSVGTATGSSQDLNLVTNGSNRITVLANGNVGVGTSSPGVKFELQGASGSTLKIVDGNQGLSKVLTSDANGVASWASLPAASGGTVTSVSSANSDISVATGTSTPVLTLNSGTGNNQIVKLDGSAKLPAVDGSALSNLDPSHLSAAVGFAKGGTGLTAGGTANQVLGMNNAGNAAEYKTIAAGSGITVTHAANSITIATSGGGGTVSSVDVAVPTYMSTSGGPITGSGTITLGFGSQTAKTFFAAPAGSNGAPTFRNLTIADIQSSVTGAFLTGTSCGAGQALTWSSTTDTMSCASIGIGSGLTGTLPIANGGTGTTDGSITGTGALTFAAGGTNQNVTLTPSGTGFTLLNGKVGVGTSTPADSLQVNGTIRNQAAYNNNSSTTIDWSKANTQYTAAGCTGTPYTFSNMRDGGVYTLVVTGTFSASCTFGQTSPDTLSGTPGSGNFYFLPANSTASGSNSIYSFMRVGSNVYVTWNSGFTN